MLARAMFGDDEAGNNVRKILAKPPRELHSAERILKGFLGPFLSANDNASFLSAVRRESHSIILALHEAIESTVEQDRRAA